MKQIEIGACRDCFNFWKDQGIKQCMRITDMYHDHELFSKHFMHGKEGCPFYIAYRDKVNEYLSKRIIIID